MPSRESEMLNRKIQVLALLALVVISIGVLASSDIGKGSILGVPAKMFIGLCGIVLLVVVTFAAQKILFASVPESGKKDSGFEDVASEKALGRYYEIKYGTRRQRTSRKFEDFYKP